MERYIPYIKMSKKKKKIMNANKRRQWKDYGCLHPVTKKILNKKKQESKQMCRKFLLYKNDF